jgi:integrase
MEKFYRVTLNLVGKHSPHSWRTVFSTWARDAGKDRYVVEAQLDHITANATETSYDRAKRLERRRELLVWHEAALLAARDGAAVLPIIRERKA